MNHRSKLQGSSRVEKHNISLIWNQDNSWHTANTWFLLWNFVDFLKEHFNIQLAELAETEPVARAE